MNKKKLTFEDFKENKALIFVTVLLAFLAYYTKLMVPQDYGFAGVLLSFAIELPLTALWLQAFWNRILLKIIDLPAISYGVAFILIAAVYLVW